MEEAIEVIAKDWGWGETGVPEVVKSKGRKLVRSGFVYFVKIFQKRENLFGVTGLVESEVKPSVAYDVSCELEKKGRNSFGGEMYVC